MAMPADAINAIVGGTPAAQHLWVMNEAAAGFTTFADQVVTGNKPMSKGTGVTPSGWGNILGLREIGGPQTPAPSFDGTSNASVSASGATLGGLALGWGIICWIDSTITNLGINFSTLYCERGSSGNDVIRFYINQNGTNPNGGGVLALQVCDDTAANLKTASTPATDSAIRGGKGRFNAGGQMLGVSVSASGQVSFYCNGPFGIGQAAQLINTSHTWSNAGLTTYIGFDPNNPTSAFNGAISWVATFAAPFTADQFNTWYKACTPAPTHGFGWTKAISGAVFPNSQLWNDKLSDTATIDPNSTNIITQWRTNYGSLVHGLSPAIPMFDLDRVGRNTGSIRSDFTQVDQQNFLAGMPVPDTFLSADPFPANLNSDAIAWACQPSTGLQYDIFQLITLQPPTNTAQSALNPPWITAATPSTTAGSLPAGKYFYSVTAVNSNGESYGATSGYGQSVSATLSATGQITLSVTVNMTGTPAPTSWKIYRSLTNTTSYQFLTSVNTWTSGSNTWTDDGSITPTAGAPSPLTGSDTTHTYGRGGTAYTQDWASIGGGGSWDFNKNAACNPCWKPSAATNNGASASSTPSGAGVITLEEALNGSIPHPLVCAINGGNNSVAIEAHRWPAPRHDGTYNAVGYPTMEGMRLRLPAGYNENGLTYSTYAPLAALQKAIVVALRDYGMIIRDGTQGAILIYAEDTSATGRNGWSYLAGGRSFGSTSVASVLDPIPWSSLQVLAPFRYPSKTDASGRRTNRLDVSGNKPLVPY